MIHFCTCLLVVQTPVLFPRLRPSVCLLVLRINPYTKASHFLGNPLPRLVRLPHTYHALSWCASAGPRQCDVQQTCVTSGPARHCCNAHELLRQPKLLKEMPYLFYSLHFVRLTYFFLPLYYYFLCPWCFCSLLREGGFFKDRTVILFKFQMFSLVSDSLFQLSFFLIVMFNDGFYCYNYRPHGTNS